MSEYIQFILATLALSFSLHLVSFLMMSDFDKQKEERREKIVIKIVSLREPPTPKPVLQKKPLVTKKRAAAVSQVPPPVIQGLSKDSFSSDGSGSFSAPIGNSMMVEDKGIREKSVPEVAQDLSERAQLLEFSKPNYTQDALDAEIEGQFIIDAFVDEVGKVTEAELRKKVGYGMDDKLIQSALAARFHPRKDPGGRAVKSWEEIVVVLRIP